MGRPVESPSGARGRRRRRALCAARFLLLVLLFPRRGAPAAAAAAARPAGETCRRWRGGDPVPLAVFLCPEESDGADAALCCGTCARTYCCSSVEAWLDQRPCFRPGLQGEASPEDKSEYFLLGLVVSLMLVLLFGGLLLVSYESLECCVGPCEERQDPPPVMTMTLIPVSASEDPSRPSPLDFHVPSSSSEVLVLPSSDEDPLRD
ncbi:UNVERIFIED_CONTAM: hypothetical protein K2H54_048618 [Gekko kuhli]